MIKLYIVHSGIKGQKWGVRRYQNPDGSLTPLGKKRYGSADEHGNAIINKVGKQQLERDYNRANAEAAGAILSGTSKVLDNTGNAIGNIGKNKSKTVNKADYSKLSDDELRKKINRLSMERNYGELTGDTKRIRTGQDWVREILQTAGAAAGVAATIALTVESINKVNLNKKTGGR